MNLDKISQAERVYMEQNDQLHQYIPPSGTMRKVTRPQILGPTNIIDALQSHFQNSSPNNPFSRNDTKTRKFPRLDPLFVAASITGFYRFATKLSLNLSSIIHNINGEYKELHLVSQNFRQYSKLLRSAQGIMTAITSIIYDSERLTKELEVLLSRYIQIYNLRYSDRLMRMLTWNQVKQDIMDIAEQIDFLMTSL
ncbi:hypothetical protein N7488_012324 [Penicillium malachiteum]|nr:hypothetical protein N7488_012324 [Penicillium malachiteum]